MKNNFDLKKFLVENKLTTNSRQFAEAAPELTVGLQVELQEEVTTIPSNEMHQTMLSYIKPEFRDKYAKDYDKYFNFLKANSKPLSGPNRPQVWVKFLKDLVKNKVTTLDKLNTFSEKYNDGRKGIEGLAGYLHKQGNVKQLIQIDNL